VERLRDVSSAPLDSAADAIASVDEVANQHGEALFGGLYSIYFPAHRLVLAGGRYNPLFD